MPAYVVAPYKSVPAACMRPRLWMLKESSNGRTMTSPPGPAAYPSTLTRLLTITFDMTLPLTPVSTLDPELPCDHAADAAGLVLGPPGDAEPVPLVGRRELDRSRQSHPQRRPSGGGDRAGAVRRRPPTFRRPVVCRPARALDMVPRLPAP